jgi:hypothetical protein
MTDRKLHAGLQGLEHALHGAFPPTLLHFHSFASLICLKRIYNFLCSMLVFTPFALCFVTLHGIFMHFPEITY